VHVLQEFCHLRGRACCANGAADWDDAQAETVRADAAEAREQKVLDLLQAHRDLVMQSERDVDMLTAALHLAKTTAPSSVVRRTRTTTPPATAVRKTRAHLSTATRPAPRTATCTSPVHIISPHHSTTPHHSTSAPSRQVSSPGYTSTFAPASYPKRDNAEAPRLVAEGNLIEQRFASSFLISRAARAFCERTLEKWSSLEKET